MLTKKKPTRPAQRGTRTSQPKAEARTPEMIWKDAMRRARGEAVRYSSHETFEVGARLSHPTFGEGVVARLQSPTVCEVIFATGPVKLLMHDSRRI